MVEVNEVYEGLHISLVLQDRPLADSSNLNQVHLDLVLQDNQSKVLNLLPIKPTLLQVEK